METMAKTMQVLYVEDDKTVRDAMHLFFESYFKKVVYACNGEEGFRYFQEEDFDLIITDIAMPGMNGIEMIREIRKIDENIPIIITSAYSDTTYFQQAISSKVDGYLIKPINILQFEELLDRIVEKIQKRKEINRYLEYQYKKANYDQLTGLYNRYKIEEIFVEISKHDTLLSIAVVDIDYFKQINDRYGHIQGDRVLERFADLFYKCMRHSDHLGRWGGEEFVVLSPGLDPISLQAMLESIRSKLLDYDFGIEDNITFSAGIAMCRKGESLRAIIHRADEALYIAKSSGRDRIIIKKSDG